MRDPHKRAGEGSVQQLARNIDFVVSIIPYLDLQNKKLRSCLSTLVEAIRKEATADKRALTADEWALLQTLEKPAKAVISNDFSFLSESSVNAQIFDRTIIKISEFFSGLSAEEQKKINSLASDIIANQTLVDENPDHAVNEATKSDIKRDKNKITGILDAAKKRQSDAEAARLAAEDDEMDVSDFFSLVRQDEAEKLAEKTRREIQTIQDIISKNNQEIAAHKADVTAQEKLLEGESDAGLKMVSQDIIRELKAKIAQREEENRRLLAEGDEKRRSLSPIIAPPAPAHAPAPAATSVAPAMIPVPPLASASTSGSTGSAPLAGAPPAAPAPAASPAAPAPGMIPVASPAPKGRWEQLKETLSPSKKPAAPKPAVNPNPALTVKFTTADPNRDYQKRLSDHKNDINLEFKNRSSAYKLKGDKSSGFKLNGPIDLLIHADGRIIANETDRKNKDYATHLADAQEAIHIMNFQLGFKAEDFEWERDEASIAADKKAEYDKRVAEIRQRFSTKEQFDAGDVDISAGPADGTKRSDYKLSGILKNTTYIEAIKKAVGTLGYVFENNNQSMTRTWSKDIKRTIEFGEDGTLKARPLSLYIKQSSGKTREAFMSLDDDEIARSKIIAKLSYDFIAMLRFYATLYIKGGAAALPGEFLDFQAVTKGLKTAQQRAYEKMMPEVQKNFMKELSHTQAFTGKAYYPEGFQKLIKFNGQLVKPAAQPTPPPSPPSP